MKEKLVKKRIMTILCRSLDNFKDISTILHTKLINFALFKITTVIFRLSSKNISYIGAIFFSF